MNDTKRLVMIGSGMAGTRAIEEILAIDPDMFRITVFSDEKYPNYNRIQLPGLLAGDTTIDEITLNDARWYKERGITLRLGAKVTFIDRIGKSVIAEDGTRTAYDALVIATGAVPSIASVPGSDKKGVFTFRNIDDCRRLQDESSICKKAVVIGGGLLGLETAKGLAGLGMDVAVIHRRDTLMNRQLDLTAGLLLKEAMEKQGVRFHMPQNVKEILGEQRVRGVRFADGSEVECDMVIMAAGISPNKALAEKAGLLCNRGIVVNDCMQTLTDPSVYAVGECVEHRGITYGVVAPLYEQGRALAHQITGAGFKSYGGSAFSTRLKVGGIELFCAGALDDEKGSEAIEYQDKSGGIYKKLLIKDDTLIGAVMFGSTEDGPALMNMIDEQVNIGARRDSLIFGQALPVKDGGDTPPDTIVCGCSGVTKQTILDTIAEQGLSTLDEVIKATRAGGSCGGCSSLVNKILASSTGAPEQALAENKPLCGCTSMTHDQIKAKIKAGKLYSACAAMQALGWEGEGCDVCRPALNYYVGMIWPQESADDEQFRLINEQVHANIQKDGSFSVVPRAYGGVISADNLVRIGEVAKKHDIPAIKLTGGQRIALLGVKKEKLVDVWRDLGMPSGYAYGKAVRTVKTCVGATWCRFGTQKSMELGARLEKSVERAWTPAKLKMGVSGCPRNCAEATIKDFGVVAITGGWQIHLGGNGGIKVRVADLLCTVKTDDEVMEIAKAFIQHNRETGLYGERAAPWVERIGLDRIKKAVVDDIDARRALVNRMEEYLEVVGEDPWEERVAGNLAVVGA